MKTEYLERSSLIGTERGAFWLPRSLVAPSCTMYSLAVIQSRVHSSNRSHHIASVSQMPVVDVSGHLACSSEVFSVAKGFLLCLTGVLPICHES